MHLHARILSFAASRLARDVAEDLTQEMLILPHEKVCGRDRTHQPGSASHQMLRFKMLDAHRKPLRRGEYNEKSIDEHPLVHPGDIRC